MNLLEELGLSPRRNLPVIMAAEGAECGLAAMAMIARYYGQDVDINGLRLKYSISMSGATLRDIMSLAGRLTFSARALKVDINLLHKAKLPAIIHWDLNHFVVLKAVRRGKLVIHDPALGRRVLSMAEASDHYTGVLLELQPASNFRGRGVEAKAPIKLRSLWSDMRGLVPTGIQVLALSIVLQALIFIAPFQTQLIVDEAIGRADRDLLTVLAFGFAALAIIQAVLGSLRSWAMQVLSTAFTFQIRGNLMRHMLRLSPVYFERRNMGDILSRLGSVNAIQDALTRGIVTALLDGVMTLLAGAILFLYSPVLAMVVVVTVAANFGLFLGTFAYRREVTQEMIHAMAAESTYTMETVRSARTLKVMNRGTIREGRWRNLYAKSQSIALTAGKIDINLGLAQQILMGIQAILVLYLGAKAVMQGDGLSIGMLMAFMSYRQTFSNGVNSLTNEFINFRLLSVHMQRLADIVSAAPEAPSNVTVPMTVRGEFKVRRLAFRYGETDRFILHGVDMDIPAGDFLAITGPSGAGKSTLLKLLMGMHAPTSGDIHVDGLKGSPAVWETWRERVGVVFQDDQLLSGSLAENIAFFDPEIDMKAVQQAAESARVHDDIMAMPMKYQSLIGDMGSSLSGGQKQRVLLARALYRQPEVLFLDEGTAHLDEKTEEEIADLIVALPITRIVVAHRPAIIRRAHRVATVAEGRVRFIRDNGNLVSGVL